MKRTELRRTPFRVPLAEDGRPVWSSLNRSPLSRGPSAIPVPLLRTAARTTTGFSAAVKLAVRKRAGNGDIELAMCEACGKHLGRSGGQVHHRVGRGAGGCRDGVINGPANAALLCGTSLTGCHGKATVFTADMGPGDKGFWLGHGTTPEFDPRNVPVKLASEHGSGILVWLTTEGGYSTEPPQVGAA